MIKVKKLRLLSLFFMIAISAIMITLPVMQNIPIKWPFLFILLFSSITAFIEYKVTNIKYYFIEAIAVLIITFLYSFLSLIPDPLLNSFFFLGWMLIISGVEILHLEDRYYKQKNYIINVFNFFIILSLGIFTCIYTFYTNSIIILSFFTFIINGLKIIEITLD